MPFPRRLLNDGEDVVLELRPHWWVLAGPAALVVVLLAATVAAALLVDVPQLETVAAGVVLAALARFVVRYLQWATTVFVVTTDRLVHRSGVLSKTGREIPLNRLNDITVHQTPFERLLRAGDLMLESGGERGQTAVRSVRRPFEVQNVIYREIDRAQARLAEATAGARPLSIPEQIDKLDELRRRGVISQAEFDVKKAQLLDRL